MILIPKQAVEAEVERRNPLDVLGVGRTPERGGAQRPLEGLESGVPTPFGIGSGLRLETGVDFADVAPQLAQAELVLEVR